MSHLCSSFPPTGIISEEGLREEVPVTLQHLVLKVALALPASKFLWLKAQVGGRDPASVVSSPAGSSAFWPGNF